MQTHSFSSSRRPQLGGIMRKAVIASAVLVTVGGLGLSGALYVKRHSPAHLTMRASLALDQGDTDRAISYLQEALAKSPTGELALRTNNLLSKAYIRAGREEDARAVIEKSLAIDPQNSAALDNLVDSYVNSAYRRYRVALKPVSPEIALEVVNAIRTSLGQFDKLDARMNTQARYYIGRAKLQRLWGTVYSEQAVRVDQGMADAALAARARDQLAKLGDPKDKHSAKAIEDLRTAMIHEPTNKDSATLLGRYLLEDQQYPDVLAVADKVKNSPAESVELVTLAANATLADEVAQPDASKRQSAAVQLLEDYLQRHAKDPRAMVAIGQIELERNNIDKAEQMAEATLAQNSDNLDAVILKTQTRLARNKVNDAIAIITPATNQFPNVAEVWYMLGVANSDAGNFQAADDNLRKAEALLPGFISARRMMLLNYLKAGNNQAAARLAPIIVQVDRYFMPAWRVYVETLTNAGQSERLRKELTNLMDDRHFPASARPDLVYVLSRGGMRDEAEKLYAQLPASVRNSEYGARLQAALRSGGMPTLEAQQALADAVKKYPQSVELRLEYSDTLLRTNMRREARQQLDDAAGLAKTPEQFTRISQMYLILNQPTLASVQAQKAMDLQPRNTLAAALLQRSQTIISGQKIIIPNADSQHTVADIQRLVGLALNQKDYAQALTLSRSGLARDPANISFRVTAARAYKGLNQVENAVNELLEAVRVAPQDIAPYDAFVSLFSTPAEAPAGIEYAIRFDTYNQVLAGYIRGQLALIAGKPPVAAEQFQKSLLIFSASTNSLSVKDALYTGLLKAQAARNDDALLIATTDKIAQDPPFANRVRLVVTDHFMSQGKKDLAANQLKLIDTRHEVDIANFVAQRWLQLGDPEKAIASLSAFSSGDTVTTETHMTLADAYTQAGKHKLALRERGELLKAEPGNPTRYVQLATLQAQLDEYPAAFDTLRKLETLGQTGRFMAISARVRMMAQLGLIKAASDELALSGQDQNQDDARTLLTLGLTWSGLKRPEESRKYLAQVPSYAPEYIAAQLSLARVLAESGKYDDALKILQTLADSSGPGNRRAAAIGPMFQLLVVAGRPAEALELANAVRASQPATSQTWINWTLLSASAARDAGQYDLVINLLKPVSAISGGEAALLDIALSQLIQNKPAEARAGIAKMPDTAPAYGATFTQLLAAPAAEAQKLIPAAGAHVADGLPSVTLAILAASEPDQRATLLAKVLDRSPIYQGDLAQLILDIGTDPARQPALRQLAIIQRMTENGWLRAALPLMNKLRADFPNLGYAVLLHHRILNELKHDTEAQNVLTELRKLPQTSGIRAVLAQDLAQQGKYEQAAAMLAPVAKSETQHPDVLLTLASYYEQLQQLPDAIKLVEQYQKIRPNDPAAANNLAYLLIKAHPGDARAIAEARKQSEAALAQRPDSPELKDTRAWIYLQEGKPAEALKLLVDVLKPLSLEPAVHYHAGLAYARTGRLDLARLHLANVTYLAESRKTPVPIPEVAAAQKALAELDSTAAR